VTSSIMTRKAVTVAALTFLAWSSACAANPNGKGMLVKAKEAYAKKGFIASVQILNKITPKTAEVIYWVWKNEKEIGRLADPGSKHSASPHHKYYLYAQNHPEYLRYDEILGGAYTPTLKRYEELKALFPQSEYLGTVLFELVEYAYQTYSEGGLNEQGRISMISKYQRFINRYPQHPYVTKAQKEIEDLEGGNDTRKRLGFVVGGESMLLPYGRRFNVDQKMHKKYVDEWIESGPYREFGIEVFVGTKGRMKKGILDRFNIPKNVKRHMQDLLENGRLIVFSEAAFRKKDWQGPKFLVFQPKTD